MTMSIYRHMHGSMGPWNSGNELTRPTQITHVHVVAKLGPNCAADFDDQEVCTNLVRFLCVSHLKTIGTISGIHGPCVWRKRGMHGRGEGALRDGLTETLIFSISMVLFLILNF